MKPYPTYKPSGIPWLGDIPAHWEVRRLKNIAQIIPSNVDKITVEGEKPVKLCNYVDVYKNEHIDHEIDFMKATATDAEINKFLLKKGDVLITKDSESWNDIAIPALVTTDFNDVLCGYHLALLRPQFPEIDGNYLFRSLQSKAFNHQFEIEATGITRYGIDYYAIGNTFFLLPPLAEQQAIAAYLDGETARLDALADRYRRLLALLDEKRRALITHAVTRGLNPTAPLKDSGIEWLGRIPEAWKIAKIKHIVDNTNGSIRPGPFGSQLLSSEMESGDIKVYNQRSVINHDVSVGENFITEQKFRELRTFEVSVGDILITSRGTIGKCLIVPENAQRGIIHPCLIRIRLDISKILREYFSYVFQESSVIQDQLFYQSNATTIEVIYSDNIKRAVLALPPITEQRNIVEYLDRETARLDDLKAKIETLLARLGEYRAALISVAVTGKMDVRRPAG